MMNKLVTSLLIATTATCTLTFAENNNSLSATYGYTTDFDETASVIGIEYAHQINNQIGLTAGFDYYLIKDGSVTFVGQTLTASANIMAFPINLQGFLPLTTGLNLVGTLGVSPTYTEITASFTSKLASASKSSSEFNLVGLINLGAGMQYQVDNFQLYAGMEYNIGVADHLSNQFKVVKAGVGFNF